MKILFKFFAIALLALAACSKNGSEDAIADGDATSDVQVIPLDEALKTLGDFMAEIEPDSPLTKSGLTREIASIDTHYKANALTKVGDPMPDAYVLNFANGEGYAVLGANSEVAPIVALTENGSIDVNVLDADYQSESLEEPVYDENGDFGCFIRDVEKVPEAILRDGMSGGRECVGSASPKYAEVPAMLNTRWTQGDWDEQGDYNKYCVTKGGCYALAGCSTIAAAQIIAYNASVRNKKYPICYLDKNTDLNCKEITSAMYIHKLSAPYDDQASQLIGWIFDNASKLSISKKGTPISAAAIATFLTKHAVWYYNVTKYADSCFSNKMIKATSDMLEAGKPVFVSAFSGNIFGAHSWVIDGAKYASKGYYRGDWMLHCNWGWGGEDNGYFSVNCFMASDPNAERDPFVRTNDEHKEYKRLFRVLTYDLITSN